MYAYGNAFAAFNFYRFYRGGKWGEAPPEKLPHKSGENELEFETLLEPSVISPESIA